MVFQLASHLWYLPSTLFTHTCCFTHARVLLTTNASYSSTNILSSFGHLLLSHKYISLTQNRRSFPLAHLFNISFLTSLSLIQSTCLSLQHILVFISCKQVPLESHKFPSSTLSFLIDVRVIREVIKQTLHKTLINSQGLSSPQLPLLHSTDRGVRSVITRHIHPSRSISLTDNKSFIRSKRPRTLSLTCLLKNALHHLRNRSKSSRKEEYNATPDY